MSAALADQISVAHPLERTAGGKPSEFDFWQGPIARATEKFGRDFDSLLFVNDPRVRVFTYPDPVFGAISILGVHNIETNEIELVDYWSDPGYRAAIASDPS